MGIASHTKGDLFTEFADIIGKIDQIDEYVKREQEKYGIEQVISHNDIYEPNYIATGDGDMYLIDWEYGGYGDPAHHFGYRAHQAYRIVLDNNQTDNRIIYGGSLNGFFWRP